MVENPTRRPGTAWAAGAIGLVLLAYAIAFGPSTVYSVQILFDPTLEARNPIGSETDALLSALYFQGIAVTSAVLAAVLAWRVLRLSAAELGLHRVSPGFPFGLLGAVAAAYLAMQVGSFAESIANVALPAWTDSLAASPASVAPATGGWESQLTEVVRGIGAAVSEELLVLALPIAIAVRLGCSTPVLLAVLVTLRLPYHLWHGPRRLPGLAQGRRRHGVGGSDRPRTRHRGAGEPGIAARQKAGGPTPHRCRRARPVAIRRHTQ